MSRIPKVDSGYVSLAMAPEYLARYETFRGSGASFITSVEGDYYVVRSYGDIIGKANFKTGKRIMEPRPKHRYQAKHWDLINDALPGVRQQPIIRPRNVIGATGGTCGFKPRSSRSNYAFAENA